MIICTVPLIHFRSLRDIKQCRSQTLNNEEAIRGYGGILSLYLIITNTKTFLYRRWMWPTCIYKFMFPTYYFRVLLRLYWKLIWIRCLYLFNYIIIFNVQFSVRVIVSLNYKKESYFLETCHEVSRWQGVGRIAGGRTFGYGKGPRRRPVRQNLFHAIYKDLVSLLLNCLPGFQ